MRSDLESYIVMLADQSIQMRHELEKINKAAKLQDLPPEMIQAYQDQVNMVEANYQRVLYCKYLLDLKPKWIRKLIDKKNKKKAAEFAAKHADRESVREENEKALEKVRELNG